MGEEGRWEGIEGREEGKEGKDEGALNILFIGSAGRQHDYDMYSVELET